MRDVRVRRVGCFDGGQHEDVPVEAVQPGKRGRARTGQHSVRLAVERQALNRRAQMDDPLVG
eukprot:4405343-Prymnesium_polylepis.1